MPMEKLMGKMQEYIYYQFISINKKLNRWPAKSFPVKKKTIFVALKGDGN